MGWINVPDTESEHVCPTPDISVNRLADESWITKLVWQCDECGRMYKVVECDIPFGPMWEWSECWPWERWWYRHRAARKISRGPNPHQDVDLPHEPDNKTSGGPVSTS